MVKFLSCCSILALTVGCVSELKVQEVYAPLTGDIIRSVVGPTDEGGGVRVSGIQTLSRRSVTTSTPTTLSSSLCNVGTSTTRTVKRRLCDGRVVTRQVRVNAQQPPTYEPVVQSGYVMQDSQFFPGVGMAQTAVNATIGAVGFAGGSYLGRPPASNFNVSQGDNTSSNYSTSAGSSATGGSAKGGSATGGNATGGSATGGSSNANSTGGNANANATGGNSTSSSNSNSRSNSNSNSSSNPVLHNVSNVNNTNTNENTNHNQNANANLNTNANTNDNRNSSKSLNNQSYQFHIQNPYREKTVVAPTPPVVTPPPPVVSKPHEKVVYKPTTPTLHEDKKPYKHDDKPRYENKKQDDKKNY